MPDEVKAKRPRTDAQRAGEARYKKAHLKRFTIALNDRTDTDIIEALDRADNKQAFVKFCIRDWLRSHPVCID